MTNGPSPLHPRVADVDPSRDREGALEVHPRVKVCSLTSEDPAVVSAERPSVSLTREDLAPFCVRRDAVAAATWAAVVLGILLTLLLHVYLAGPITFVLAFLLIGGFQHHLSVIHHEAVHYLLFRKRSWNEFAGRFLAAYTIARHYELAKEVRKGLFYAQLALDRASSLNQARHAESLNQIANFQVAESRFNEALETYAEAQQHLAPGDALRHAVIGYNVGYCRVVLGSHRAGLRSIYQSLRRLRRLGAERHEMLARLDLAFALLEFGKARLAERHASRAIELASQFADPTAKKNALYLAGAAASARGDEFTARRRFAELQGDFFPEADYLPDLLLSVDVRSLVNLKA